jgi:hypothetical protein
MHGSIWADRRNSRSNFASEHNAQNAEIAQCAGCEHKRAIAIARR